MNACLQRVAVLAACALLMASSARALAAEMPALPAGGQPVFDDVLSALGTADRENGYCRVVDADGPGFSRAMEMSHDGKGNSWDLQSLAGVPKPMARGDAILLAFWARTVRTTDESGQGFIWPTLGENRTPYTKSLERTLSVPTEWTPFLVRGRMRRDYEAGQLNFGFGVGQTDQTLQVGGIQLLNYGDRVAFDDLPQTRPTYPGREPDAAWRAPAAERIRELRTAPFTVRVVDDAGRPVAGADVTVKMKRHAFGFGAALTAARVADPNNGRYRDIVRELFSSGSFVNALKWPAWDGNWGANYSHERALEALKWMKDSGIPFRGHVLVWPSWRHLPRALREFENDPAALRQKSMEHIDEITQATKGYVKEWDVINEPYDNHDLMDICGQDIMVEWFKRARQNLPDADLALNDYNILVSLTDNPHMDDYEQKVKYLLDNGAPITVLGLQGHFGGTVPSPDRMWRTLERYAKFGLPIRVTEFTIGTDDEDMRADFMRDALTLLFSHPSVIGVQFWELSPIFSRDLEPRKSLDEYRRLVLGEWWTNEAGETNRRGEFSGTGYLGLHDVTVTVDGKATTQQVELTRETGTITVRVAD